MWSVFFVFLSYLDRNVVKGDLLSRALVDAEKESEEMFSFMLNNTFCAKVSMVRESFFLYQVSDGAEAVSSVLSPDGKLVDCSVTVDHVQVKSFMHQCRLGVKEQRAGDARQMETRFFFTGMDEARVTCREFKERSRGDSDESVLQDQVLKRSKRGFTYPGTLWCGAGNMADHYGQLGNFAETDSCCRTHDHCPHVIHAFSSNYGHTNFKWHSICHCDCDNALKDCLRKVNDTSSRVVGQAFFNVIGVPCFEFAYEEQCAERHWYGMCKRYEKFPIAVLEEAVPYDFGGIAVIDELTLAPPKEKESKKSEEEEEEKPESTTQSTMSGPEEPSFRNVVTAAEDFIKVLATVSTSQSSAADSDKGETQSSEKKKRKNTGKKKETTKKRKGKGKGRKRKQKAEEGAAVSPSGGKAEEVIALSNFISESHKHEKSSRNTNGVGDGEYKLGRKEPFNEVMKDEPAMDKETVSITSPPTVQKKPAESTEEITLSTPTTTTTVIPHEATTRRLRKGRRKKSKKIPLPSTEEVVRSTTDNISVTAVITIIPTAQPEQQSFAVTAASTPIVISKVKRNRSKERGDREGRKKRRKLSSASSIVAAAHENSSADNLKAMPLTGAPTVPSMPITERQVSHRMDAYGGKTTVHRTPLSSSFSVLKSQKSKGLRSRRRKTVLPLSSENPLFPTLPTPETSDALKSPASTPAEETETHSEWRLFTTITAAPSIIRKRHRPTIRQQRKPRKKAMAASLGNGVSIPKQTEQTSMTFTTTPPKGVTTEELHLRRSEKPHMTTSASPIMSPIQLSIERVRAQFNRKKRRKAARSVFRQ
ncbi:uncharacterized protein proca1 [Sebastes fasciatus]|uniref:uncharacterized protein proca1 n=1 Tax=Sebastes fasciatus TaxID=394691 RepID=UPI003D9F4231